jgi:hypothetical protein
MVYSIKASFEKAKVHFDFQNQDYAIICNKCNKRVIEGPRVPYLTDREYLCKKHSPKKKKNDLQVE